MVDNSFRSNFYLKLSNVGLQESVFSFEFFGFLVPHGFCFYESLFRLTAL